MGPVCAKISSGPVCAFAPNGPAINATATTSQVFVLIATSLKSFDKAARDLLGKRLQFQDVPLISFHL